MDKREHQKTDRKIKVTELEYLGDTLALMGVCLADHRHRWTGTQRARFERAAGIVRRIKK